MSLCSRIANTSVLAFARIKSENVGSTEVLDKLDKTKFMRGIFNPNTIMVSIIFLFVSGSVKVGTLGTSGMTLTSASCVVCFAIANRHPG